MVRSYSSPNGSFNLKDNDCTHTTCSYGILDMFIGDTFESFLPLFNVYALFRPSRESGIGAQGKWKDTSFRLYRDGTELRGIYCADPLAAKRACRAVGKYACDFPSLIGNDPY